MTLTNLEDAQGVKEGKRHKGMMGSIILSILLVLVLTLVGVSIYGYTLLNMIDRVPLVELPGETDPADPDKTPQKPKPISRDQLGIPDDAPKPKDTGITNILVFGLDRRSKNEPARSDAMMIATIDRKRNEIKLTSLMRDMYVTVPGRQDNRINTGHVFGGPALAIKTVNQNFQMNIEHYVSVDFFGFEEIIDLLDGVDIAITSSEARVLGYKQEGTYTLSGSKALTYSRIRKIGGDFERTDRQRTVLEALFQKMMHVKPLKVPEMMSNILPYIETNLTNMEIIKLSLNALDSGAKEVQELRLPINGAYSHQRIRGMAVLVPDIQKNTQALHSFIYDRQDE